MLAVNIKVLNEENIEIPKWDTRSSLTDYLKEKKKIKNWLYSFGFLQPEAQIGLASVGEEQGML